MNEFWKRLFFLLVVALVYKILQDIFVVVPLIFVGFLMIIGLKVVLDK